MEEDVKLFLDSPPLGRTTPPCFLRRLQFRPIRVMFRDFKDSRHFSKTLLYGEHALLQF